MKNYLYTHCAIGYIILLIHFPPFKRNFLTKLRYYCFLLKDILNIPTPKTLPTSPKYKIKTSANSTAANSKLMHKDIVLIIHYLFIHTVNCLQSKFNIFCILLYLKYHTFITFITTLFIERFNKIKRTFSTKNSTKNIILAFPH